MNVLLRNLALLLAMSLAVPGNPVCAQDAIRVGSKSFTENFILGEIVAQIAEAVGEAPVERRFGLGATAIAYEALAQDEIDIYPEYTGTITFTIINDADATSVDRIRERLAGTGVTISDAIGFSNTSALAVSSSTAERLGIRSISDIRNHPDLSAAFGAGYLDRPDGWPGLQQAYGVSLADIRVIEHTLKYEAVSQGEVDLIDVYTTDAKLLRFDLRILDDDLDYFPDYQAVMFIREDFVERFPRTGLRLQDALVGGIDDDAMSRMNAAVDLDGASTAAVAAAFTGSGANADIRIWRDVARHSVDHLYLVLISVGLAIFAGIPLGVMAARLKTTGRAALVSVEVVQTIPSLALLVFMIPIFGIGQLPALVALFLYALLPIVRNTYIGIVGIDPQLTEMARLLGLDGAQTLRRVELPLASMTIMAGIKTSTVITVGTATLAAFIGGGGYGTLIVRGLALNDNALILAGALPAAIMAMVFHAGFEWVDRIVVPRGLRISLGHAR